MLRNYYTFIIIIAFIEGFCVELVFLFSTWTQLKLFMTGPFICYYNEFGIWLLGYRIELGCVYIPQGNYFMSSLWLWTKIKTFDVERKSIFNETASITWTIVGTCIAVYIYINPYFSISKSKHMFRLYDVHIVRTVNVHLD